MTWSPVTTGCSITWVGDCQKAELCHNCVLAQRAYVMCFLLGTWKLNPRMWEHHKGNREPMVSVWMGKEWREDASRDRHGGEMWPGELMGI
jgi:hypothetical protein